MSYIFINIYITQKTHNVVLTSVQRYLNLMDVGWTSKRRLVLAGKLVVSNEQKRQYPNEMLTIYRIMVDLWDIMERYGQIFTIFGRTPSKQLAVFIQIY